MAWGTPSVGIQLLKGGVVAYYSSVTSTSTIEVAPAEDDAWVLRMYLDPSDSQVPNAVRDNVKEPNVISAGLDPAPTEARYICYLDSDTSGDFSLELTARALPQTWIATYRDFSAWPLVTPEPKAGGLPSYASGGAMYQDPCVVPVPTAHGGGYLMVLLRKRTFLDLNTLPQDGNTPISSQGVFDLIAYWSDNPEFNDPRAVGRSFPVLPPNRAVHGPIFLVDEDPDYKSAVVGSDYSAYFTAEKGFIGGKRFDWSELLTAFKHPPPESTWTSAVDGELLGRIRIWLPRRMKSVRRRAEELLLTYEDSLKRCTDPEPESFDGDSGLGSPLSPTRSRARSQANGPDEPSGTPFVPGEKTFALYFRALAIGGPSLSWRYGQGLWRATAIPHGTELEVEEFDSSPHGLTTVLGVDFVVTPNDLTAPGRDMVAPASVITPGTPPSIPSVVEDPMDPDVVHVTLGSSTAWWVFGGSFYFPLPSGVDPTTSPASVNNLGRVIGDEADGTWEWSDAWSHALL